MIARKPNLTVRREAWLFTPLILCLLLCACSQTPSAQTGETRTPPFEVRMELNKNAYRPGELVQCNVKIVNLLDDNLRITPLQPLESRNLANLNFYVGIWGEPTDVVRRTPVEFNPPGRKLESVELPALGQIEDKFSFVNLTENVGEFKLQAHYTTSLAMTYQDYKTIISQPLKYVVKGKRVFQRDGNGMIVESDAVRTAVAEYGKLPRETRALMVPDEKSGLLKWWVTIEKMPYDVGAKENPRVAYYVSPYGGQVQPAQSAFAWKEKEKADSMPAPTRTRMTPAPPARAREGRPPAGAPKAPARPQGSRR